jgi:hypothetical protein
VMELPRRLGDDAMSLPSCADDGAAESLLIVMMSLPMLMVATESVAGLLIESGR